MVIHQGLTTKTLGDVNGVMLIDKSGVVKQGQDSVGVAWQYYDLVGKEVNSEVGVHPRCVNCKGHTLLDSGLIMLKK